MEYNGGIMELRERQRSILGAVVREYVRTARPVASQDLMHERDLDVGSATIRNEMLALDELGYLEQPYTSAGRVPTDKGYRFFVDHLLDDSEVSNREQVRIRELFAESDDEEVSDRISFVKDFSRTISQMTGAFTAAGLFDDELFYDVGFSQILKEPEFQDSAYVESFGKLVDLLDDEVRGLCREARNVSEVAVFIGHENPLREGRGHAMILSSWQHPAGFGGFLTLIGPKRMDYQHTISLLRCIRAREDV
jgi:transcriptional regulator of heat shock response